MDGNLGNHFVGEALSSPTFDEQDRKQAEQCQSFFFCLGFTLLDRESPFKQIWSFFESHNRTAILPTDEIGGMEDQTGEIADKRNK